MIPTRFTFARAAAAAAALTLAAAGCKNDTPPAGTPAAPPTTNTTTVVPESADARLAAEIRAKLGPSRAHTVNVEAKAGEVKLQGMVSNHEERETIERLVRQVAGVKEVDNHIAVEFRQPPPPPQPERPTR